jgi:hypothetical protein
LTLVWDDMTKEERIEALRPLRLEGVSQRRMAAVLKTTRNAVSGYIDRYLIDLRSIPDARKWNRSVPVKRKQATTVVNAAPIRRALPKLREIPVERTKLLFDRERFECAYVVGPVNGPDTQCCGATVESGTSWCSGHRAIVFGGHL